VDSLSSSFVWPLAARNIYLLVYLGLVAAPILRAASADRSSAESGAIAAISIPKNQAM
jgi:hypothetical protein